MDAPLNQLVEVSLPIVILIPMVMVVMLITTPVILERDTLAYWTWAVAAVSDVSTWSALVVACPHSSSLGDDQVRICSGGNL